VLQKGGQFLLNSGNVSIIWLKMDDLSSFLLYDNGLLLSDVDLEDMVD
jgi:hypothetical protein